MASVAASSTRWASASTPAYAFRPMVSRATMATSAAPMAPAKAAALPPHGQPRHGGDYRQRRGRIDVEQVHGHLSLALHLESGCLHRGKSAARGANPLGDLFGDRDVRRVEIDVERHQEGACADGRRAGRRMDALGTEVGIGARILPDALPESLEFAFAN